MEIAILDELSELGYKTGFITNLDRERPNQVNCTITNAENFYTMRVIDDELLLTRYGNEKESTNFLKAGKRLQEPASPTTGSKSASPWQTRDSWKTSSTTWDRQRSSQRTQELDANP